ncbi:MAG TPA: DUF1499 domain-containing protein [Azospirillaceae bacterium]|nr:DUF1499 domain-containing protein [Azospirillaceae bacterium]
MARRTLLRAFIGGAAAIPVAACERRVSSATGDAAVLDPVVIQPPTSPNHFLAAPAGATRAVPDAPAPVFALPADRLADAWVRVLRAQPRVEVVSRSPDGLLIAATATTAVMGFVDDVVARVLPQGEGRSTIAVYSASRVGYWDIGTNRARITAWLAALDAEVRRTGA